MNEKWITPQGKDESMTETKQWMGLHNHDRHFYSPGYGDRCGKCWYCSPETPCYCCLQAEVEALQAQVQRVRLAMSAHKVEMYVGALRVYAVPTAKLQIALDTDE